MSLRIREILTSEDSMVAVFESCAHLHKNSR